MLIVGIITVTALTAIALLALRNNPSPRLALALARRQGAAVLALVVAATAVLTVGGTANAAIVPTINLGTSGNFSVLAGQTVTNTGPSVLDEDLGLSPGSAITGFPPGLVLGATEVGPVAALAQNDLTTAYNTAELRPINATVTSNLGGLTLVGGVYAGPDRSPLTLTGPLVLDGEGDPNSVFIFQTDSTLITDSASSVLLIDGAQACNVFWQVGSSATLGTGSTFVGNILALTSITATTGAVIEGRALARNGSVTLDSNVFTAPSCDLTPIPTTTTTTEAPGSTTTTEAPGSTTTTEAPGSTTTTEAPMPTTTERENPPLPPTLPTGETTTTAAGSTPTPPGIITQSGPSTPITGPDTPTTDEGRTDTTGPGTTTDLPVTGAPIGVTLLLAFLAITLGAMALTFSKTKSLPEG